MSKTLFCQRCFHNWKTNKQTKEETLPKYCPKCHNPSWQVPPNGKNKITEINIKHAAMAKALSKIQEALDEYKTAEETIIKEDTIEPDPFSN